MQGLAYMDGQGNSSWQREQFQVHTTTIYINSFNGNIDSVMMYRTMPQSALQTMYVDRQVYSQFYTFNSWENIIFQFDKYGWLADTVSLSLEQASNINLTNSAHILQQVSTLVSLHHQDLPVVGHSKHCSDEAYETPKNSKQH